LEQSVGGTAGQSRIHRIAVATAPTPNAFGDGEPNEPGTDAETFLDSGSMTSLSIGNLTPTSGSGTFSFTNGAASTVSGSPSVRISAAECTRSPCTDEGAPTCRS